MLPLLIASPLLVWGYNKYTNNEKEIAILKYESDLRRQQYNDSRRAEIDILAMPFMVSVMYVMASVDEEIDTDEEHFISTYIKAAGENVNKEIWKILIKIQKNPPKKLSDTFGYIDDNNEKKIQNYLNNDKKKIQDLAKVGDMKIDEQEQAILNRLQLIIDKGRKAKEEIIALENQDLLPNYYFSSTNQFNKLNISTVVITNDDKNFLNIGELQYDKYYVKHPMNPNYLFDLQELDKIEEFQIIELQSLASKLGATKFSCSVVQEETESQSNGRTFSAEGGNEYYRAGGNIKNNSSKEEYEKKFTQYKWEAEGKQEFYTKDDLINSLLWLKHDRKAKHLIDTRTSENKIKSYQFEISFKQFRTSASSFNLDAHLSLLNKIDAKLKAEIESNIKKSLDYKLNIDITF